MPAGRSLSYWKTLSLTSDRVLVQAFWVTTFAILTAVGAQIEIPHQPVPYTFQTFFVLLAGALLGKRNGFLSMGLYLTMGVAGLPVFSAGGFGFAKLMGPTGGYLLSFPIAAFLIGYLTSTKGAAKIVTARHAENKFFAYAWTFFAMSGGLLVVFTLGTIQLNVVYFHNWNDAFNAGFLIFSWWDVLKLCSATAIYQQLARR